MSLRSKILVYYFAISLIALFAFGINAFHIAQNSTEDFERKIVFDNAKLWKQDIERNAGNTTLDRILNNYADDGSAQPDDQINIVIDDNGVSAITYRESAIERIFLAQWEKQNTGEDYGSVRIGNSIYHWAILPIGNTTLRLVSALKSADEDADTAKKLIVRLFSVGATILWISAWFIVIIATAVSKKLDEQTKTLEYRANYDALTELPNRAYLIQLMKTAVNNLQKNGQSVVLIVLDLDRFKAINDTLGQHIGDSVLKIAASRLSSVLWKDDRVARLEGDKFALLLPLADRSHCKVVLEKMAKVVSEPFIIGDAQLEISLTAGISFYPEDSTNPAELISHAEAAMYIAKNRHEPFAFYDPTTDPHNVDRLKMVADLKHAANRNELFLCYQPLIDVSTGDVIAVEALARWQSPTRGLVMPDKFIPIAEQTGLIKPMTYNIIDVALAQCAAWQRNGIQLKMAVNLSARLVHDKSLPETVANALTRHGVAPSNLELEITETSVMLDPATAIEVLCKLDLMGVSLSIDDFGSGYTSLAYLKKLPVDSIKIDRSFVMNMMRDPSDALVVHTVIDLAHNLSRTVVAEGVENELILDELTTRSCDIAQGYFFTKPLPVLEFEQWLARYNSKKYTKTTNRKAN